jgi:hypothetical protein
MCWEEAHRYNAALRAVETDLNTAADGRLVWRPDYQEIFGSPERLLQALRSRWETMVHAQIGDDLVVEGRHSEEMLGLASAHPGLVGALARAHAIDWIDAELRAVAQGAAA